jgi:hypothetical protein
LRGFKERKTTKNKKGVGQEEVYWGDHIYIDKLLLDQLLFYFL